jgi:hypothetical protein
MSSPDKPLPVKATLTVEYRSVESLRSHPNKCAATRPARSARSKRARNVRFEAMTYLDVKPDARAKFAGSRFIGRINEVARYLQENPAKRVEIRTSVGLRWMAQYLRPDPDFTKWVTKKRAEAVIDQLTVRGIDPSRLRG